MILIKTLVEFRVMAGRSRTQAVVNVKASRTSISVIEGVNVLERTIVLPV
jgi:hypothetical protein